MAQIDGCQTWREVAHADLPELSTVITEASSHLDMWWALMDIVGEASTTGPPSATVESIFGYAWWCVAESDDEWLAAEVRTFFYENLPEYCDLEVQVPRYVTPWQFERLARAFRYHLGGAEYAEFSRRYHGANRGTST